MMARTVFPDYARVEDGGGRSLSSIPPERITDVRLALESSNASPVAIPGCHWKWPFDLVHRNRTCHSPDLPLAGVRLLVIGSTLNSGLIDVPNFILDDFIVLILRITTDPIPAASFCETVDCLLQPGMTPIMSMIGMSAGVDRCLSIVVDASDAMQDVKIVLSHFVAIYGATLTCTS